MILKGFRFGMILQLAVGPVCLFIFQTAVSSGTDIALLGVAGVSLVDASFILAAIMGLGTLLNRNEKAKNIIKFLGAGVVILFGLSTVLGVMGVKILPSLSLSGVQTVENVFVKTMLLTLSNPLTILFWAGVFSSKVAEEGMDKSQMYQFGLGAVLSTVLFLSFIAVLGNFVTVFLSANMMSILNVIVGLVLIAFGVKSLMNVRFATQNA